jgi:hypothetical protein
VLVHRDRPDDALNEVAQIERLGDEVGSAEVKPALARRCVGVGGEKDQRDVVRREIVAEFTGNIPTVEVRQPKIDKDQVRAAMGGGSL